MRDEGRVKQHFCEISLLQIPKAPIGLAYQNIKGLKQCLDPFSV
jgi:hypothetical protein